MTQTHKERFMFIAKQEEREAPLLLVVIWWRRTVGVRSRPLIICVTVDLTFSFTVLSGKLWGSFIKITLTMEILEAPLTGQYRVTTSKQYLISIKVCTMPMEINKTDRELYFEHFCFFLRHLFLVFLWSQSYLHISNTSDFKFSVFQLSWLRLFAFNCPNFADSFAKAVIVVSHQAKSSKGCCWEEKKETMCCLGNNIAKDTFTNVICDDCFQAPMRVHDEGDGKKVIRGLAWENKCPRNDCQHSEWKHTFSLP